MAPNLTIIEDKALSIGGDNVETLLAKSRDYARIAEALDYVAAHAVAQPELSEIAEHVGLSSYHFQRLFTRWVGISPKKFLQYVTLVSAKQRLLQSASVLDAALGAGLSGPGRLHDLFVTCEAVTPGEYKQRGQGLTIRYGYHSSPFGECLLMSTERGICGLAFVSNGDHDELLTQHCRGWQNARIIADQEATRRSVAQIFAMPKRSTSGSMPLRLLLRGTQFQIKVWEALLSVPAGALTTYEDLARRLGYRTGAAQAVGQAVGSNVIAYLIPCHRVIRKSGLIGGYRWGATRKLALIGWEAAQAERATQGLGLRA